jgi:rfaE bifunctional protein nucleotidyltransferase chain/domain
MPVVSLPELLKLREAWRERGLRAVLTNGVFDIVHAGHVAYLSAAREQGDLLVVALNSDRSTQALKGPLRPIVPESDRAALLAALRSVDYVTIFDETTAEAVATALRPEIYVKGGDYAGPDGTPDLGRLPEGRIVAAYGGHVALLPFAEGRSTSGIIARIVERYGA